MAKKNNILNFLPIRFASRPSERVAVIIPVYNVTTYLEKAIRSAYKQNYPNKEIIVIDDGSSIESAKEIERICGLFSDVTLLKQPHVGAAAARDYGVKHTQAEWIIFLDGDDMLCQGALRYFAKTLRKQPEAVAAYARVQYIDSKDKITGERFLSADSGMGLIHQLLERGFNFCNGSICIRRKALESIHPNNYTMPYGEDWVLWCHLALAGAIIPAGKKVVLYYRKHEESVLASFLKDPTPIFSAYETVFIHPDFIAALGAKKLGELKEKCMCRLNMHIARLYAEKGDSGKAAHYMDKVNLSFAALFSEEPIESL